MKENIKLSILWVFSFLVIIFMMTLTAHADEPIVYDGSLPFTYAGIENYNSWLTDDFLDYVTSNPNLPFDDDDYVLVYVDNGFIGRHDSIYYTFNFYFYLVPITNFSNAANDFNIFQNSLSYTVDQNKIVYYVSVSCDYVTSSSDPVYFNSVSYITNPSSFNPSMFGYVSVTDHSILTQEFTYDFTSYVPVYFVKDFYSSNNNLVLKFTTGNPVIDVGVAIIPPAAITPVYPSGFSSPNQVPPTYNPSDYQWTTPPTFDGSSVENALGSIMNLIGWLSNNLKEEFKNLSDNLEGFFKYIGDTIQYYGNSILVTLNNFIQNFYDNMSSLVQPIFEKIAYITTPLEASVIWDNISTTSLVTNISTIQTSLSSFQGAFTGVSEPNEYKIPIHLENLPSSWFGTQTTQYIDLGIINGSVKDGIRLFVWAMVTYGLVVTIFDSIANYINGGGDES